jgi:integrase
MVNAGVRGDTRVGLSSTVYLAAGCGLRLGEILGLEVGDLDLEGRELHIRRQLKVLKRRQPYLGPVKTKTSVRTIELPDVVAAALTRHLARGIDTVARPDPAARRRRPRPTGNGGHVGWEPSMTAVPQLCRACAHDQDWYCCSWSGP